MGLVKTYFNGEDGEILNDYAKDYYAFWDYLEETDGPR